MQVWPAIDVRGGKCVRLEQGDYGRETVFGDDPAAVARGWVAAGAERLHVVDLDGARDGRLVNHDALAAVVTASGVPCQLGGGVRSEGVVRDLLALGLARLVVGTRAVDQPDWFRQMCRAYPGRLALGIDARDGRVATHGWRTTHDLTATDLAREFAGEPLAAIVYTDIQRDGMLEGPNFAAIEALQRATGLPVIASGGVTTTGDVERLARLGVTGCIIGRALYEGTLSLGDALAAAHRREVPPSGSELHPAGN